MPDLWFGFFGLARYVPALQYLGQQGVGWRSSRADRSLFIFSHRRPCHPGPAGELPIALEFGFVATSR